MPPNSTFECSWFLPFPFRVFLMSENVPDEERLASIIDFGNQSVLVPGNVEYHIGPHPVCTPKNLLQLRKALPRAASRNAIPMVESGACVGTCRLELSNRLIPDDVHAPPYSCSHNGNSFATTQCHLHRIAKKSPAFVQSGFWSPYGG